MSEVKRIARFISLLSLALWFALSCGSAFASDKAGQAAPATDHAVTADGGHGASKVSNSLSAAKVKDLGWRVVNFIALMIILVKFGAKPIGAGLAARQKKIKDEIEDLQQKRADAEKSYNDFQAKLATVESEIDKIVDRAVAQAEIEKVKILEKAEQAAHDIQRSAEMAIQNELTEARRTLKNEVAEQAAIMAEKLIVNNLTADDQVKIIDNYLVKVGAVQ
ncbi:MAG: F0F1 ATP synthase subunit B [Desulforhopalus sp.]|nr:F0F1 ATP synthase subunit B [Desulforhopalus sp.]